MPSAAPIIDLGPDGPSPVATPSTAAVATDEIETTLQQREPIARRWILLGIVAILLAVFGAAVLWFRRRRDPDYSQEIALGSGPTPLDLSSADPPADDAAPPVPPAPAMLPRRAAVPAPFIVKEAPAPVPRAWIDLALRPIRAGTNLTNGAVDYEIDLHNSGEAPATDVRIDIRLMSASADQDAVLAAVFAQPVENPPVAPFGLPVGETVSLGGMAMIARATITVLSAQGRQFFVPVFSVNVLYRWGTGDQGQTACAWVIGIERGPDAKMTPFRLDTGPRMHDAVGQRPHALAIVR